MGSALSGVGALALCLVLSANSVLAAEAKPLNVSSSGFKNRAAVPADFAFCVPAPQGHVGLGPNKNPPLKWAKGPAGTQSYAVIVSDPDAPSVGDDVNKEGKTIKRSLRRVVFYHWVLVDIPARTMALDAAADSNGVTAHGKPPGPAKLGVRGINDYTGWFSGDDTMKGNYGGYDGPCPPWNDTIVHHYHFTVYALDVPSLGLAGTFGGKEAMAAIAQHTLSQGEIVGTYSLNPGVGKKKAKGL